MTPDEHRAAAVEANNATWELLDGRTHGAEEVDELLGRAYAAAYHWRRATDANDVNHARASWLLSRAHATVGHGDLALHHAERCAHFTAAAGDAATDFDQVYVVEARARALAALGRDAEASEERARAVAIPVADAQDREIVEGDLAAGPWYGLSG